MHSNSLFSCVYHVTIILNFALKKKFINDIDFCLDIIINLI